MKWFWLSFCDPEKTPGEQFLGVSIVEAPDMATAPLTAWYMGCNPGGEIRISEFPAGMTPLEDHTYRILTKPESMAVIENLCRRAKELPQ